MAEYYFISQLPSLDAVGDDTPLPISEEQFSELCSRFLGKKLLYEAQSLTLIPPAEPERSSSPLIEAWNTAERDLRFALGKVRAEKMNKPFDMRDKNVPAELLKVAVTAVEMESPMDAERFLSQHRLSFLETLRPTDTFSNEYIFYYGLKLKLILRIRKFDTKLGEIAYRNIYSSILNGDSLEA